VVEGEGQFGVDERARAEGRGKGGRGKGGGTSEIVRI